MSRSLSFATRPLTTLVAAGALLVGSLAVPGAAFASESHGAVIADSNHTVASPRERAIEGGIEASDPLHQRAVICWIAPTFPWICKQLPR
ncbi:hypothetical protein DEO23_06605 [Brachybacterium endophyticum]|uniref:Uncharacterized protein n=1 Tax=Brachybacterium endophyticum TaxID=2182385 RepID=A0A2U2RLA1_9MICO|nr:hypothetical protein [Brachybacterium endophyticum]PWH06616.1 hypothetical protein DEO23_06605 [Brachybacterium endophyticum]